MSDVTPKRKKLYIETVGCQMNLLDSELVVGKLRNEGYELTDDIDAGRHDPLQHLLGPPARRGQDLQRPGPDQAAQAAKPELTIGVLGCMAQKDQGQILKRAPHVDVVVGPGQLARVSELLVLAKEQGTPQMAVSLPRTAGTRETVTASFAEYDPIREPAMRPSPVPGVRPDHDGLRQVLHLLHRPLASEAPSRAGRRDAIVDEARALADQGVKEITLLGQTVNSYKYAEGDGRTARLSDLLARLHEIEGLERIKFITNFPNDMTDDLLEAVRDLPKVARYLHVPAQSGCDEVLRRMKRMYSVALYDDMLARIRETVPEVGGLQRLHRRLLRRDRGVVREVDAAGRAGPVQEQLHLQVQPPPGDQGRHALRRRRARGGQEAAQQRPARPSRRRSAWRTIDAFVGGRPSRCWSRGRASRRPDARGAGGVGQLTGRTPCDRIVVFEGHERLVGHIRARRGRGRQRRHAVRPGGHDGLRRRRGREEERG